MKSAAGLFGFLLAMFMSPVAHAQNVTATDPQTIVRALQSAGYRAELTTDDVGDPLIRSASSGNAFVIFFHSCTDNRDCRTIQFFAGFSDPRKASLAAMNEWNTNNRFGRAYRTDNGSTHIQFDLDLDDGGMSEILFVDNLEYWVAIMDRFVEFIYAEN